MSEKPPGTEGTIRAKAALDDFRRQPRSRLVWRHVIEPLPIEPRTVLVTVDPETAEEWLRCRVSPAEPAFARVRHFAKIMATGLWHPREDEPIELKVSDAGVTVLDGQHRLAAVVVARQPVKLLVRMS